jgi:hypothetical protein
MRRTGSVLLIFLRLLQLYNKLTGSNFCLGNGSYVD